VNSRDNNFTQGKIQRRQKQIEESVARYMSQLDTADRQTAAGEEPSETVLLTKTRLKEKLAKLDEEAKRLAAIEKALLASPDKQISLSVLSYNLTRVLNIVGIKPLLAAMRA
jgi:transposase